MKTAKYVLFCLLAGLLSLRATAAPPSVTWSARLEPSDARAGEGAQVVLVGKLPATWHVYSLTQPDGGPRATKLELLPGSPLTAAGKGVQPPPKKAQDTSFNIMTEFYEETAVFGMPVKIAASAKGKLTAKIKVKFQICNDRSCLPPDKVEVPITFSVAPGAARPNRQSPVTTVPKATAPHKKAEYRPETAVGTLVLVNDPPAPTGNTDELTQRIDNAKRGGLLPFLLLAFGAGFLALLTPCVFPMIPITVSFFAKRKQSSPKEGIKGALAYCLGIIGTFTGLGLLMTALFGGTGIQKFATNPIVNLGLAVLFVVLAANLMGAFEIIVPQSMISKAASAGRQNSLLGPVLMGLTFSLTSFTCTVGFVGTLLATAAQGSWFYPTVGMLAFSITFSMPFFLLALFPQFLSRIPKSGSWLVSVKAFMGFLELAAALKFLSNADLVWGKGWITRPVFLAVWATIGIVAGLYLLGWLRLPVDDAESRPGWTRRGIGVLTVLAAMYCLAGINGAGLGDFAAFLPPKNYGQPTKAIAAGADASEEWIQHYDQALKLAKAQNKPMFINFTGVTCTNCRWMENNMFPRDEIKKALAGFIKVELYTDKEGKDEAESDANKDLEKRLVNTVTLPVYVIITPDEKVLKVHQDIQRDSAKFLAFIEEGRNAKVASTQ